jgi:S-DNA-T family DNA segregation ATPase FtsK/SpoIIIE
MTTLVRRPARRPVPPVPAGDILLDPPPQIPPAESRGWGQFLQVVPMMAGTFAFALLFMFSSSRQGPLQWVIGAMFGVSALGMLAVTWGHGGGPRKGELIARRREYMRYLSSLRRQARRTVEEQRTAMFFRHPDPDRLWATATGPRLWERRPDDDDHLVVRVALGPQELSTLLIPPPSQPLDDLEPMCAAALQRFLSTFALVPDLPVAISLRSFAHVHVDGDPDDARALARAVIAQLAVFHAPDDVLVAVAAATDRRHLWEWTKWLPHALHPTKVDALGQVRLVGSSLDEVHEHLADLVEKRGRFGSGARPHVVIVTDGVEAADDTDIDGVTVVRVGQRPPRVLDRGVLTLRVDPDGRLHTATIDLNGSLGRADRLDIGQVEALARQLAPLRLSVHQGDESPLTVDVALPVLLGIPDVARVDTAATWAVRAARDRLRVPLGVGPDGARVHLDLKESALGGMGPHGLLIGATGSGKSELLRTLVVALAVNHPPETLNFVLIDFKGGATFTRLDRLPHTSAVITNLRDELPLVDRMTDAISGELIRRQELLRQAGNYANIHDYERARAAGTAIPPLPELLVVCDEFSELLTSKPDFIDMFVQIGRLGRALGVHLLLASQRLDEGRLRGLETHLSYRIALRTFSTHESRVVLGVTDAYELPQQPGHALLKAGTGPLRRFRAAYVSGPYRPVAGPARGPAGPPSFEIRAYGTAYAPLPPSTPDESTVDDPAPPVAAATLLDMLVGQLAGRGVPAHQVWLPPLREAPALNQVLPPLGVYTDRGLTVRAPHLMGALRAAVGLTDLPFEQRRDVLWLDLAGANGHVAVVGGPQSGKSTALRTIICSLALTHTPAEVQCYGLDFGGGSLATLRGLPHVGGVALRQDRALLRRTVAEMRTLLDERERVFAERSIDSTTTFRRMRATGALPGERFGDVFLFVDNWVTFRAENDDLEAALTDIATRGLSYGVHVVATATRWMDFRTGIRDLFGTKLELRIGDTGDSLLNRKAAANVPENTPGRGITAAGTHFITALPRIDSRPDSFDLTDAQATLTEAVVREYSGPSAPAVRLLPARVPFDASLTAGSTGLDLPLGLAEADLRPVSVDFGAEPHALLFGDTGSGKSTFLRMLARVICARFTPEQARIVVVDYRRSLLGAIATEHLIGYGSTAAKADELLRSVAGYMRARLPGPDVTPAQLRDRSWWRGPECFVLVDDYDLVATGQANPLAPLVEFLAQARDIGLHLVLTRRSGGAGRAMYEPVVQRLRELGSPGVVLSGDRDEGALLGNVRPERLPPGRGWLVTRRDGARLVQLADVPADERSETQIPAVT